MKIQCTDGTSIETDNLNNNYLANQYEEVVKFTEFCKTNNIYIWAFTLDKNGQGGGFYNLPSDLEEKLTFMSNMDNKIDEISNHSFRVLPFELFIKQCYGQCKKEILKLLESYKNDSFIKDIDEIKKDIEKL